jgi:hypothetical protein
MFDYGHENARTLCLSLPRERIWPDSSEGGGIKQLALREQLRAAFCPPATR